MGGASGLALLHHALEAAFPGRGHAARRDRALGVATRKLARARLHFSLFGGFAGIGWVVDRLQPDAREDDAVAPIDEALLDVVEGPWEGSYDLLRGLVGVGVYALERLPRAAARLLLGRVLDRLSELAEPRDGGVAWVSRPEWIPPSLRRDRTRPYLDCGVAHGIPGVIGLLAAVALRGLADERARRLLQGAVEWQLQCRIPTRDGLRTPHSIIPGVAVSPTREAWCYGDLGVSVALFYAGRALLEERWTSEALSMARRAARLPFEASRVEDACVCHGAAGYAHLMHRYWQATGEPLFRTAARRWIRVLLDMRRPGRAVAGFPAVDHPGAGPRKGGDVSLLNGTAGVGLVLASALGHEPVRWDAPLLLADLVPR